MQQIIKKISALGTPLLVFFVPLTAMATELANPLGYSTLTEFLRRLLQLVVEIGFPVVVLFVIIVGFRFVTAAGKPEELAKVRMLFLWTLIGALIVLGAQALSLAIQGTVEQLGAGV